MISERSTDQQEDLWNGFPVKTEISPGRSSRKRRNDDSVSNFTKKKKLNQQRNNYMHQNQYQRAGVEKDEVSKHSISSVYLQDNDYLQVNCRSEKAKISAKPIQCKENAGQLKINAKMVTKTVYSKEDTSQLKLKETNVEKSSKDSKWLKFITASCDSDVDRYQDNAISQLKQDSSGFGLPCPPQSHNMGNNLSDSIASVSGDSTVTSCVIIVILCHIISYNLISCNLILQMTRKREVKQTTQKNHQKKVNPTNG